MVLNLTRPIPLLVLIVLAASCSVDSVKNRYLLAEKLWSEENYSAAVTEFDRVNRRDTEGELGRRALLRSAMTQTLFLNQHEEALRKLRQLIEQEGDSELAWDARKQVGEILFSRLEDHRAAIKHYQELALARPSAPELPEFLYRIAQSQFHGWAFDDALLGFERIIRDWPQSVWAEKASFQVGSIWLTRGEQRAGPKFQGREKEVYQEAIRAFNGFASRFPQSKLIPEALFGRAVALEELDQLELALAEFEKLEKSYPTPQVIQIRMIRLRERLAKRRR